MSRDQPSAAMDSVLLSMHHAYESSELHETPSGWSRVVHVSTSTPRIAMAKSPSLLGECYDWWALMPQGCFAATVWCE